MRQPYFLTSEKGHRRVNQSEYTSKLDEFDYLMNDPEADPAPERVWEVLAALSFHDLSHGTAAE
ncbi:MAG: hypothetical protein B7Z81_09745 [Acidocella sp. 20-61-6]|nr:MAG: hypothetical protein B7Z81_09745 [Acidocella sp. 20-61-6]